MYYEESSYNKNAQRYSEVKYNEDLTNSFNEELFIDNEVILIALYGHYPLYAPNKITNIKSYEFENDILKIKFGGILADDYLPECRCYLIFMFKCDKHTLADLVAV
jgi:hypothetical protein